MVVQANASDMLEVAIIRAVHEAIDRAIEDETDRAVAAIREKIRAQKATIAMGIMRHFDLEQGADRFIITVRDTVKD